MMLPKKQLKNKWTKLFFYIALFVASLYMLMFCVKYRQNYLVSETMYEEAMYTFTNVCSNPEAKARSGSMVNCIRVEELVRMGPYEKALHNTIEDMSFCTGAQCYELVSNMMYTAITVVGIVLFCLIILCFIFKMKSTARHIVSQRAWDLPSTAPTLTIQDITPGYYRSDVKKLE